MRPNPVLGDDLNPAFLQLRLELLQMVSARRLARQVDVRPVPLVRAAQHHLVLVVEFALAEQRAMDELAA